MNRDNISYSLTANKLKVIAILAMFFDHFVATFVPHEELIGIILRTPGRIAAPIICYFIAEGYFYTSNRRKYIERLLIFAVVSHLPFNLLFGIAFFQATSIIWGLALGLIALTAIKSEKVHILLKPVILGLCCLLAITANWNYVSVLWIVGFGLFRGSFTKQMIVFSIIGFVFHLIPTYINFGPGHDGYPHWYQVGIYAAIPLLAMYNGKLGKKSKIMGWFFYIFYPAHLLFIYVLDRFTTLSEFFR